MGKLSPLRRRMIEDMRVRNLSPATQAAYVRAVAKLSRHFGRSPDRLNLEDVRAFQVHLASQGNAWSTVNQTVCALRFFYGVTLGRDRMPKHLACAHEPSKLPVVLSASEVARFLAAVPSVRSRAALTTAYAAGLRVSEAVSLKITDIDSERMTIRVEHGKGGKDRYVMLSPLARHKPATAWIVICKQECSEPGTRTFGIGPANDHELLAVPAFDLHPQAAIAGRIGCLRALADDALQRQLAGPRIELRASSDLVIAELQRHAGI